MKKTFSVMLAISLLTGICSCASADGDIKITNTEIISDNIPENSTIIAALYDGAGVLTGVKTYKGSEEKRYAGDMAEEIKVSEAIKVFVWDWETITPLGRVYEDRLENLPKADPDEEIPIDDKNMTLTINGKKFSAEHEDNETAAAFREMLPVTLSMNELNGNEKYYFLDSSLPSDSSNPGTIHEGDIMLYGNNCIVVFYKTFKTSYSYTMIGRITDTEGLADAIGDSNAEISFSSGI